ncbi:MAG TPA: hypothetical protein VFE46_10020 [Pirellulales bacterium]|jgi:hypothetical protein|nr:hypothetical protein [Pirellulales bacterium]
MAIVVVCPNCLKRFQVKEKYAGQQGKCPKCQSVITVPTVEEIVKIPEPEAEEDGEPGTSQRKKLADFKPLARVETQVQPVTAVGIVVAIVLSIAVAFVLRGSEFKSSGLLLALGALLLAPPLVWGGYTFLRDQELEPYGGRELVVRGAICACVYAILWALLWGLKNWFVPGGESLESWNILFLVCPPLAIGTATAVLSLDLDAGNGFFHYCLYFGVCVLLRLIMGLSAL